MRSFMRLSIRRKVDLPQPDGPMSAVTARSGMDRLIPSRACLLPYQNDTPRAASFRRLSCSTTGWRPLRLRWLMMAEYEMVDIRISGCPYPAGRRSKASSDRVVVYTGIVGLL